MEGPVPVLYNMQPTAAQVRRVAFIAAVLFAVVLLTIAFRNVELKKIDSLSPAVFAFEVLGGLVTAMLLFFQAQIIRSMALMALGTAYFYFAVMVFVCLLTIPGVISDSGLLGPRLNTPGWLSWFSQLGFFTGITAYALLRKYPDWASFTALQPRQVMVACMAGTAALVAALILLTTIGEPWFPRTVLSRGHINGLVLAYAQLSLGIPAIIAIFCVWRGYRSVLDLWLLLALFTWISTTFLIVTFAAGHILVRYAIMVLNLISNLTILAMQMTETGGLYAHFVRHALAGKQEHERQLLIREAAAASIAHELKQPISAIMLNAYIGQMEARKDDQNSALLFREIEEASRRANDTIQSTRSLFAHLPAARQTSDVSDLIRKSLVLVSRDLENHGVTVDLKLEASLPPVQVNPLQMQEVFLNLFINAMEAMSGQVGKPRTLTISSSQAEGIVMTRIEDTGPGIAAEDLEQIFIPFYSTKRGGTGVGLTVCQSIISAHAGSLRVAPADTGGAAFEIRLPGTGARVAVEAGQASPLSAPGALPQTS